jgi:hypothetical protein
MVEDAERRKRGRRSTILASRPLAQQSMGRKTILG